MIYSVIHMWPLPRRDCSFFEEIATDEGFMGTWRTGLYRSDAAADVRAVYQDRKKLGLPDSRAHWRQHAARSFHFRATGWVAKNAWTTWKDLWMRLEGLHLPTRSATAVALTLVAG